MVSPIAPLPVNAIISILPVNTGSSGADINATQKLVAQLADGTIVSGYVVNRDAQNNPVIRTEGGDYVIQSQMFVKTGSDVVVRMDHSAPNQAQILSIDKMTPAEYTAQQGTRGISDDTIEETQFKALSQAMQSPEVKNTAATVENFPILKAVVLQLLPGVAQNNQTTNAANTPPQAVILTNQGNVVPATPEALLKAVAGTPINVTVYDVKLPTATVTLGNTATPPQLASLLPQSAPTQAASAQIPAPQVNPQLNVTASQPTLPTETIDAENPSPLLNIPGQPAITIPPPTIPGNPVANTQPTVTTPPASIPNNLAAPLATAFMAFEPKSVAVSQAQLSPVPVNQPSPTQAAPGNPSLPTALPEQVSTALPQAALTIPPQAKLPADAGTMIQATVIGHGEDGTSIVHTLFGTLKIDMPQPLPTNTVLALTIQTATQVTNPAPIPLPVMPNTTDFEYLTTALTQLQQTDPTLARDITQHLPVLGSRFTSGLLFFLSAVKSGERKNMFSTEDLAKLDALAPGLMNQLNKDVKELNQQFANPRLEEWRPINLPLIFGSQAEMAQLYIRKEPESGTKVEKANGQRFVLDLHMSELGEMQLDGFVRATERGNAIDLFLRSENYLEPGFTDEVRTLFITATEAAGIAGNLVFQQGSEHFVKPQPVQNTTNNGNTPHTILA